MRLLLVESSIGLSGSTMSLGALVRHLDPRRFQAHVVVARREQEEYLRRELGGEVPIFRVTPARGFKAMPWAGRGGILGRVAALLDLGRVMLPYAFALRRIVRARKIDLLHQNNGFDLAALVLSRLTRRPLIAYQRGDEWHSPLVRRLAPLVDWYVANSETTRGDLRRLGVPAEKISVVYPPVDLQRFRPGGDAAQMRARFGVGPDAPCFGILGQLQEWKGQKVFLQAARIVLEAVPAARGWIVGDAPTGGEAYRRELEALAKSLGIADRIVFTGFTRDIPAVLDALDVVVHASVQPEPFGRVIIEAMAMARPVVASDAGGPREIIDHGRTGRLVPPGEPRALAEAVLALLRDPARARRMGVEAREDVIRRFSADAHARTMEDLYSAVLEGRAMMAPAPDPERVNAAGPAQPGGH